MNQITANTRILGLIGNPARHSLSHVMYNKAFRECHLDMCYFSFEIQPSQLEPAIRGMAALDFAGFNVTFPYKEAVIPYLDSLQKEAEMIGAVNTVVIRDGKMHGYNTDGSGFVKALEEKGIMTQGRNILILGAGGAAKAVGVALALGHAKSITIANRSLDRAQHLSRIISHAGVKSDAVSTDILKWESKLDDIHIVINATPVGMHPLEEYSPINVASFNPGTVICDLIYRPQNTLFLKEASRSGHIAVGGLGMLLHQGAEAFRLFTASEPPLEVMRKALDVATCQRL